MYCHHTSKYHLLHFVKSAKVRSVTMRDDFNWNDHISTIAIKAANCLYLLRQRKRAGVSSTATLFCSTVVLLDQFTSIYANCFIAVFLITYQTS